MEIRNSKRIKQKINEHGTEHGSNEFHQDTRKETQGDNYSLLQRLEPIVELDLDRRLHFTSTILFLSGVTFHLRKIADLSQNNQSFTINTQANKLNKQTNKQYSLVGVNPRGRESGSSPRFPSLCVQQSLCTG